MPKSFEITMVAKGIFAAVILSFILTAILSLIYHFTSIRESMSASLFATALNVLIASFYITYKTGVKGLVYGFSIGFGFFVLSVIIFYIFYTGNPAWPVLLLKLLVSLLAGMIGGTTGALLKK